MSTPHHTVTSAQHLASRSDEDAELRSSSPDEAASSGENLAPARGARDVSAVSCSSCGREPRHGQVLVTLGSPRGEYQICRGCLGRDAELRRTRAPVEIPAAGGAGLRTPATPAAHAAPAASTPSPTPAQAPLDRNWDRLRDGVARRDAERRERLAGGR